MHDIENLIWIDLEMTGLRPDTDHILEIATVVTDKHLRIIAEGPALALRQSDSVLGAMDEWNTRQHGQSGLIERVRQSTVSERAAEERTLAFLAGLVPRGQSPMCGNSVCQDRRFLARWMPALESWFHYRSVDVSTLKELARRWAPDVAGALTKSSTHLALADIRDSIAELAYYRKHLFRPDIVEAAGAA